MKTTIMMNQLIVSSELSMEELKKIKRFRPEELELVDPETKAVLYTIDGGTPNYGAIGKHGIYFDSVTNDGKAAVKIDLPEFETIEEKKQYAAEKYGVYLVDLEILEERLIPVVSAIDEGIESIVNDITVAI